MSTWLLLVSLLSMSLQDGHGQENDLCGPQKATVSSSGQKIKLTWGDSASCSVVNDVLIYELMVRIGNEQVHYEKVAVTPALIGSTHHWEWSSDSLTECAVVSLRSQYKSHTSQWTRLHTLPETKNSETPEVFPRDKLFEFGSRATFCCFLPAGQVFRQMYLDRCNGCDTNITKISNQMYSLTVHLNQASPESGTDVKCATHSAENGACAYVGYPPGDRDLWCETRDLESVECHWTVGSNTHLSLKSPTVYHLNGRQCKKEPPGRCKLDQQVDVGEKNWTLTAQNKLGKVELSECVDLTKRVHMFAPKGVTASTVNSRNVTLKWEWMVQQYDNLYLTCQINVSHRDTNWRRQTEHFGDGLRFAVLNDLIPHWRFNVRVRCRTDWKWSDWSSSISFQTKGDAPDAPDVWRQVTNDHILIIWKVPLANQSNGNINDYRVTWTKSGEKDQSKTTKENRLHLELEPEQYIVTVTARNMNGSSSPSTITIPHLTDRTPKINITPIAGSNGCFNLSWSASSTASCGYIVDWCPTSGHCELEWVKVPPSGTRAIIASKNFTNGVRYTLSVYACTQGAPVLLEKREGYITEKRIKDGLFKDLTLTQRGSDAEVSWTPVHLEKQPAFIHGYVLYCLDKNNSIVLNVSTGNPEATSLTAANLHVPYCNFTVKAQTAAGECGTSFITADLILQNDYLMNPEVICLLIALGILSVIVILCYTQWTCIKQKVYPPIPKPVFLGKLMTSPGEGRPFPLPWDQCVYNEADIVDALDPLKKCTPQSLTLHSTFIPSQSGLQFSAIRSEFHNPSYNLMLTGDQSSSGPEPQQCATLERSSSGYQAHCSTETFTVNKTTQDQKDPMHCDSSYVLLPQKHSK